MIVWFKRALALTPLSWLGTAIPFVYDCFIILPPTYDVGASHFQSWFYTSVITVSCSGMTQQTIWSCLIGLLLYYHTIHFLWWVISRVRGACFVKMVYTSMHRVSCSLCFLNLFKVFSLESLSGIIITFIVTFSFLFQGFFYSFGTLFPQPVSMVAPCSDEEGFTEETNVRAPEGLVCLHRYHNRSRSHQGVVRRRPPGT